MSIGAIYTNRRAKVHKKRQLTTPSLRFPLHAGGTLRRGAITNSARAIGMTFKVVLELSEEGGYTVYVPALLGCLSKGDTVEEALQNIREAIQLYLEPVEEPEKFLDLL
jgi:predicted RNase H-like HicB family nuclease